MLMFVIGAVVGLLASHTPPAKFLYAKAAEKLSFLKKD